MFRSLVALLALAACSAFTPTMSLDSRRGAIAKFGTALGAGLVVGAPSAFADGAVSDATRSRARGLNGPKILATNGVPDEILKNQGAFQLFNDGALKRKDQQKAAREAYKKVVTAANQNDASATSSAFKDYIKLVGLDEKSFKDSGSFQGSSSDFSWTKGSNLGFTYRR